MADYRVTELYIHEQELEKLPDDIDKYNNLEKLDCSDNHLNSLGNLPPNLEVLSCYKNPPKYDFKPTLKNIRNYNASRILSS